MAVPSPPSVLVVDDDPQVRSTFAAFLNDGFDVEVAADGREALGAMSDDIDVVLLDRRMVGLSGGDVLAELRESGFDQPVALVTAVEPDFDILEMGFDDYVTKPVRKDGLRELVDSLHARHEYDAVIREYFSLVSKVTTLQQQKASEELEANEDYLAASERLDEIKVRARRALDRAMEQGTFEQLFEDFSTETTAMEFGLNQRATPVEGSSD